MKPLVVILAIIALCIGFAFGQEPRYTPILPQEASNTWGPCTPQFLGLVTKVMSKDELETRMDRLYGRGNWFHLTHKESGLEIQQLGIKNMRFGISLVPQENVLASNRGSSIRQVWNKLMIARCRTGLLVLSN